MVMEELDKTQVHKAVEALMSLQKTLKPKAQFLDNPEKIWLQLAFKKVPQQKNKIIKLKLAHGLATETQFVCLFVRDEDRTAKDHADTIHHYEQIMAARGITQISEIIPLRMLKTMYKAFEAKRNLSNSFDMHLADDRIVRLLPAHLGKHFYQRKRHPVQVNLLAKDLKAEISSAVNNSRCILTGRGSACSAYVSHCKLSVQQSTENVMSAASEIAAAIPGGPQNIRSLHIKTDTSTALPIYVSMDSANEVNLPVEEKSWEVIEPEEVTTVLHGKVRVFPSGKVQVVSKANENRRKRRLEKREQKKQLRQQKDGEPSKKSPKQDNDEAEMEPDKKRKKLSSKSTSIQELTPKTSTRENKKDKITVKTVQKKNKQGVVKTSKCSSANNPKVKKFKSK